MAAVETYDGTFGGSGFVDVQADGDGGLVGVVYCTLAQLKAQLGIPDADVRTDPQLEGIISAVSRLIDAETKTQFYGATETLYYTPQFGHEVLTDDLLSVSTLETGEGGTYTTWAPTDYVLAPYNARTSSQLRPYWRIEAMGGARFPAGVLRGLKLSARRGFCELAAIPPGVQAVCLRESLFQAQANVTPYGMTAGDGTGVAAPTTISLSNYSKLILAEFKRIAFA
jgi:hypothetical protein